jgi:hypothetical protein
MKKIFSTGPTIEQSRQDKNLLFRPDKPNEATEEEPLSFVLFESPFASVSTVSRGHPSLVSLGGSGKESLEPLVPEAV